MNITYLIILILVSLGAPTFPHEGEKHLNTNKDSMHVQIDSSEILQSNGYAKKISEKQNLFRYEIVFPEMLFEHMHNKIVHFTVALSVAAFLFTLINYKMRQFELTIKILVLLSALAAAASYFTGVRQANVFDGEAIEWVVILHRNLGIISATAIWLWLIFLFVPVVKRYAWILGAVVFALIIITGFYGCIIAAS